MKAHSYTSWLVVPFVCQRECGQRVTRMRIGRTNCVALLDGTKEQVAYAKLWQGIVVVTDISLIGWWGSTPGNAPILTLSLAGIGVLFLSGLAIVLHRQIARGIAEIGGLSWRHSSPFWDSWASSLSAASRLI